MNTVLVEYLCYLIFVFPSQGMNFSSVLHKTDHWYSRKIDLVTVTVQEPDFLFDSKSCKFNRKF